MVVLMYTITDVDHKIKFLMSWVLTILQLDRVYREG